MKIAQKRQRDQQAEQPDHSQVLMILAKKERNLTDSSKKEGFLSKKNKI